MLARSLVTFFSYKANQPSLQFTSVASFLILWWEGIGVRGSRVSTMDYLILTLIDFGGGSAV